MKTKTKIQLIYIFQNCLTVTKNEEERKKIKDDYKELLELVEKSQKKMKLL